MRRNITFGKWENKPLEWLVLEETETTLTLWCKRVVANMTFNESNSAYYEESNVRSFLENEFYEKAFTESEKKCIIPTELDCTEKQTYYGAVGAGATAYRRNSFMATVFILSVREIMRTYALTNEEIYHPDGVMFWTRSPNSHRSVSLVCCGKEILEGESPYTYESKSYDHTTGMVDSMTFPYDLFATGTSNVIPAIVIKK